MGRPVLLERGHLLAGLDQRLTMAANGQGSLVFVLGEAGAGKSALVSEWTARIRGRALVATGACDPLTTPRPWSPLLDIASHPDAGLHKLMTDAVHPRAVYMALLDWLTTAARPTVLVIEDVHWADEATLDLLRFLGRRIATVPAVVLCTLRDEEVGYQHPVQALLGDLATRETTIRLTVEPLSLHSVETLADGAMDPQWLHELTSGNAFYVTEVLETGQQLPNSAKDAVLARVARLDTGARRVVQAVCIAPRQLTVDVAMALATATFSDVDASTSSGVLISQGAELRFRHELARAAVEASLPAGQRLQWHRQMIDLLREEGDPDPALLVHHALGADDGRLVIEHAPAAAHQAQDRGAHREAATFLWMLLDRSEILDAGIVAELRTTLASQLEAVDDAVGALTQRRLVVEHHRRSGDRASLADALVTVARSYWDTNQRDQAHAALEESLGLLSPWGPSEALARALWHVGYLWMLDRHYQPAIEFGEAALATAEQIGADGRVARALHLLGDAELLTGDAGRGLELLSEALRRLEGPDDESHHLHALLDLGICGTEARMHDVAADALHRAVVYGTDNDHDVLVALARAALARIGVEQGRWDDAVRNAEAVVDGPGDRASLAPVMAFGALGLIRARRGDPGAHQALAQALHVGEGWFWAELWPPACGLAELAWLEGRDEEIPEILRWISSQALSSDSLWGRGEVAFWLWRAGAIDEPPERIAEPFGLHISGDWAGAAAAWRELGCPYQEALALGDGDPEAMLAALEILDQLGARPAGMLLRARLRAAGVDAVPRGPLPATRDHPAGLTARQAEVLGLMVEGLANGDIAERLFISKKTVEHHVSAILQKLLVTTRAEAIAAAMHLPDGGEVEPT